MFGFQVEATRKGRLRGRVHSVITMEKKKSSQKDSHCRASLAKTRPETGHSQPHVWILLIRFWSPVS